MEIKVIKLVRKPETGKFDRLCMVCDSPYYGWNLFRCPDCVGKPISVEWTDGTIDIFN